MENKARNDPRLRQRQTKRSYGQLENRHRGMTEFPATFAGLTKLKKYILVYIKIYTLISA